MKNEHVTGWHKIQGFDVYFEKGRAYRAYTARGLVKHFYKGSHNGCYYREEYVTYNELKSGLYRGTIRIG